MTKTHDEHALYVRRSVEELVALRKNKKMTVADVVVRTGWAPLTVRRFESGVSNPTLMQFITYTDAVGADWQHAIHVPEA